MGTKHPHYDVIVAWASGEEIQFGSADYGLWQDWNKKYAPSFHPDLEWRIKPKEEDVWRPSQCGMLRVKKKLCDVSSGATTGGYVTVKKTILQQMMVNQKCEYKWMDVPVTEDEDDE